MPEPTLSWAALRTRRECLRAEKPLAYLAAPYSDADASIRLKRAHAADLAAIHLMEMGYAVFSPLSHGQRLAETSDGALPLDAEAWSGVNDRILEGADLLIILTLSGWERSRGVAAELGQARGRGIPVTLMIPDGDGYRLLPAPTAMEGAASPEPAQRAVLILDALNTLTGLQEHLSVQSWREARIAVRSLGRELLALAAQQGRAA